MHASASKYPSSEYEAKQETKVANEPYYRPLSQKSQISKGS